MQLKVTITRYVDDYPPGIVECEFSDAEGHQHTIIEKVPVVSEDWLGPDDSYPQTGFIRCEVVSEFRDEAGSDLVRVTTWHPDLIETKDGAKEFVVRSSQVVSAADTIVELEEKAVSCEEEAKLNPDRADSLLRSAVAYRNSIAALRKGHWRS